MIDHNNNATAEMMLYGGTALHCAVQYGSSPEVLQRLIDIKSDDFVNEGDDNGETSLHYALRYDADFEVVQRS